MLYRPATVCCLYFRPVANKDAYALIKDERSLTLLIFYIAYVYDRATLERATL